VTDQCRTILHVATVPTTLRSFLLPYASHFRALGFRVFAAANGVSACPQCRQAYDGVYDIQWSRNPLDAANFRGAAREVRRVAAQLGPSIVHVHTPVAAFVTRYALRGVRRRGGLTIVYTAHGFHFHRGGGLATNTLFLALEKLAGRWTDLLIVINREDEAAARRHGLVPSDRMHLVPGVGLDTSFYSPTQVPAAEVAAVRSQLGLAGEAPLFLMVAEFISRKRHRDALLAFSRLCATSAHLAFAGVGPELDTMRLLARSLGVAARTHFLGFRQDVPALIRASAAVLLPSEQEGLPRSVMEAMCLEVPIIGADIRGTRDLLKDGCGLLAPVGDEAALAEAMSWVLDHPRGAAELAARARARSAEYDVKRILRRHEELYERVVELNSRR